MRTRADVVVIGGGVMGCSILYNLGVRGVTDTVLLERDALASGSTSRSQAILRMHYSNEVAARMALESLRVFQDFEQVVGGPSGYTRTGYFLVVGDGDRRALEENVAMQQRIGIETHVMSVEDVIEVAPMLLARGDEAFAYEPASGYADPYLTTTTYARRARELGADVVTGASATAVEVAGGRVASVATPDGKIDTPAVVIASGPWSKPLFDLLGVDVPLRTLRHQVVMARRPPPDHPIVGDVVNSLSARPDLGGLTLIGVGEDEYVGPDEYNQGVDMRVVEAALSGLADRIPSTSQALFRGGWSGLFTTTPDWHPILDRVDGIEGLYCAVGFSGHGFKLSPMVGAVMAELITGGRSVSIPHDLVAELGLSRFAERRLLKSRYSMSVLA